jgi:hypothetical protein
MALAPGVLRSGRYYLGIGFDRDSPGIVDKAPKRRNISQKNLFGWSNMQFRIKLTPSYLKYRRHIYEGQTLWYLESWITYVTNRAVEIEWIVSLAYRRRNPKSNQICIVPESEGSTDYVITDEDYVYVIIQCKSEEGAVHCMCFCFETIPFFYGCGCEGGSMAAECREEHGWYAYLGDRGKKVRRRFDRDYVKFHEALLAWHWNFDVLKMFVDTELHVDNVCIVSFCIR